MLNFINTGLDEATLESVQPYTHDNDLIKAMSKQGLVQREVTVQGLNGTFTRKQWVRASEEQTNPRQSAKQDEPSGKQTTKQDDSSSSTSSKLDVDTVISAMGTVNQGVTKRFATPGSNNIKNIAMNISGKRDFMKLVTENNGVIKYNDKDNGTGGKFTVNGHNVDFILKGKKLVLSFDSESTASVPADKQPEPAAGSKTSTDLSEFLSGKTLNGKTPKAGIVSVLSSGVSRKDLMSAAKEAGVTWKENDNEGINWMRASMAIQKHLSGSTSAPAKTDSQVDSSKGSNTTEKDIAQATQSDSNTAGDNKGNTQNDTDQSSKAAELGIDAVSLKNADMNTLNTMKDSFQAGIVNLIQAKGNAQRQAEMAYKAGNDTLRKKCEEMADTYDKQADKYIAAMTEIVKEIMSRQPKDAAHKEELPKPTKMTKQEVDNVHTTYMQGDPARDIAYVLLKHPAASIVNNGADVNGNGGSVNRLLEDKAIIQYMNETIPMWQNKVKDDIDNHMKNKKDTKKWQADLQKLVNAKDYVDKFADVWSKWKVDNGK